ncbi:MAG: helix-turn-helix domain-containing protein [Acidiferrobacteraceae bacterium]
MTVHALDADWQQFILDNGWRASIHALTRVTGRSAEDIAQVRRTGACTRLARREGFANLFTLWHGRPPTDGEWPAPRKRGCGGYEWQAPELALLASLIGRLGIVEIAQILTRRLRERTGDHNAERSRQAVQIRANKIGMQSSDVLGGITTTEAGREIGSLAIIHQNIRSKRLHAVRVGRLLVIPHAAWKEWKSKRVFPPEGYVPLRTIREALSIRSDKLSEFARMGYVPTAVRCNPFGTQGPSTQFGTWYVDPKVAAQILADRRAGRPMPWHGKPMADNLRATFKRWQARRHPASCATCADIWGKTGAPRSYADYERRYHPLAHGAKRHLTRPWSPGLTIQEVAAAAGCSVTYVRRAIENGVLVSTRQGRCQYIARTDATRWRARKCPTGDSKKSWISLRTAHKQYCFTPKELRGFMASGVLQSKTGTAGAMRGIIYVSRHQCGQLREKIGFTEEQAARRAGVTVPRLRRLLAGVDWRKAEGIPLVAVQAVIKRLESREGYTLPEAAAALGTTVPWVLARKEDGTIKVSQAKWDRRRIYISEPMFQRLKAAQRRPGRREPLNADWLRLSDAAHEAGVSTTTLMHWNERGALDRRRSRIGWRYHRAAVRACARRYWPSVRFHRANPPDWLRGESVPMTHIVRTLSSTNGTQKPE